MSIKLLFMWFDLFTFPNVTNSKATEHAVRNNKNTIDTNSRKFISVQNLPCLDTSLDSLISIVTLNLTCLVRFKR